MQGNKRKKEAYGRKRSIFLKYFAEQTQEEEIIIAMQVELQGLKLYLQQIIVLILFNTNRGGDFPNWVPH